MDVALALEAGQAASVILRHAGSDRAQLRGCFSSVQSRQPLRTLLLQLLRELLDGESLEDVLGRGREQCEDGEGAIRLVLFESAAQAV